MASLENRRPSASLRVRRPSTVYNEVEPDEQIPEVPSLPRGSEDPYGGYSASSSARPQPRHAKSSDSGRHRAGGGDAGHAGEGGQSKVGAILLNKRQSVSFGKAMAASARAGVREGGDGQFAVPGIPARYAGDTAGAARDGVAPPTSSRQKTGGSRRGATLEGAGLTAGEEMVAQGPRGPTGMAMKELLSETFSADAFVKAHLSPEAGSSSSQHLDDLRRLKAALTATQTSAQESLQTNVIQNYQEFIKVSKDIAALENEMLELKGVLEEWKTVPESLEIEMSFDQGGSSDTGMGAYGSLGGGRANRRNSLADLQALYKSQLEALWEGVEGAQRFLPLTPNRHVIAKHPGWVELNSATYRPRQNVILFLLNDALLVAVEKRRQMGGHVRTVADKCFNLNEIAVTDLRDQGELINAIRIKKDREVHIFRTEKPEEKKSLLSAFKRILEETMSRKRKESVWEAEHRRDTVAFGSSRRGGVGDSLIPDMPTKHPLANFRPSTIFSFIKTDDPSGKDLSWIDDISDQLAVHIALHEFESACGLIELAKSTLPTIDPDPLASGLLRNKIEQRSNQLCQTLLGMLSETSIRKTGVVKISNWLMRLGQGEVARETFLKGRGELLKQRTGDIVFSSSSKRTEGGPTRALQGVAGLNEYQEIVEEVAQLAFVCFTLIRNTCEWYMAAYKDHQTASAFVRWASTQVGVFSDLFKSHVYPSSTIDHPIYTDETISRCLEIATSQAAMLKDVGLDFAFLLSIGLSKPPPQEEPIQEAVPEPERLQKGAGPPPPPLPRRDGPPAPLPREGTSQPPAHSPTDSMHSVSDMVPPRPLMIKKKSNREEKPSAIPLGGGSRTPSRKVSRDPLPQ